MNFRSGLFRIYSFQEVGVWGLVDELFKFGFLGFWRVGCLFGLVVFLDDEIWYKF